MSAAVPGKLWGREAPRPLCEASSPEGGSHGPTKPFLDPTPSQGAENPFPQRRRVTGLMGGPTGPGDQVLRLEGPEILRASHFAGKDTGRLGPKKLGEEAEFPV